jgi:hypothetical protein
MKQKTKTALHEAAQFVGFSLYVGADKIGLLSGLEVTPTNANGPPVGRIEIPHAALTIGKIQLCALAADYIASGKPNTLDWLKNATAGNPDWSGISTKHLHIVFKEVVSDLRGSWSAVQVVADALEQHGHVAGKDLHALARLAGLTTAAQQAAPVPQAPQQAAKAPVTPWFKAALTWYYSLKNLIKL